MCQVDIARQDLERLLVMRHRQQVIQIDAVGDAPGEVLRHQLRLETIAHSLETCEVSRVDPGRGSKRQTDAVDGQLEMPTDLVERLRGRTAIHVVFGVYLEPAGRRTSLEDLCNMRVAKTDASDGRDRRGRLIDHDESSGGRLLVSDD